MTLHQLFEQRAAQAPEAVAVELEGASLSYGELDGRADRLARHLRSLGVGPEVPVGLLGERTLELAVGMLAILKAGGVLVLLDPAHPDERLRFMLRDAGARGLVTAGSGLGDRLAAATGFRIDVEGGASPERRHSHPPPAEAVPQNLAYVIYTSGSTGRPKGVAVPHSAVSHHNLTVAEHYRLGPGDRVLQTASISFDLAIEELFPTWARGATVVLQPGGLASGVDELLRFAARQRLSVVNLPTPFWHQWAAELDAGGGALPPALRLVIVGTEQALADRLATWRRQVGDSRRWLNAYGPSEATITATVYEPAAGEATPPRVPIGRPIPGVRAEVVDRRLSPVAGGESGELCLGGTGLARGYLHRPALTAERFVPDPFSGDAGTRLYATGDRARRLGDGNLEFLGRFDHQVKIRGFRIELGEIEAVLSALPEVAESAVVTAEDPLGEQRLIAWVVAASAPPPAAGALRAALSATLPEYMVPALYRFRDALPRTPSGKLDRPALKRAAQRFSAVAERPGSRALVPPRSATEELLAAIWSQVLGVGPIGVGDDFFELGGHSLMVARVLARLRDAFGVELAPSALFTHRELAELARAVDGERRRSAAVAAPTLAPGARSGPLPLSFAQQRLWLFEQTHPGLAVYNIVDAVRLAGRLDPQVLALALAEIVRRHETLRTLVAGGVEAPRQAIGEPRPPAVPLVDLAALPAAVGGREASALGAADARRLLDPAAGPLLRFTLLRLAPTEHHLLLTIHHIAADGWSMEVFYRELAALYQAFSARRPSPLPELEVQYADFAVWQRGWLEGEVLASQLAYWQERLAGWPAALELPTDRPRPAVPSFRGGRWPVALPRPLRDALGELSRRQGTTLFMTLLAAFQALLFHTTRQHDLAVGSPSANRNRRELEHLIGFFVNMLVLRADLAGDPALSDLLQQVRRRSVEAYDHQDLPFERLVETSPLARDPSRHPIFQVFFQLIDASAPLMEIPGLEVVELMRSSGTAKFDLELTVIDSGEELSGYLEYASDLFDGTTVGRLLAGYRRFLEQLVDDPERRLSELDLLGRAGRQQVLVEWNDTGVRDRPPALAPELFSRRSRRAPEAVAVVRGDQHLSYRELEARANRLAHHLLAAGVRPDDCVGLMLERSLGLVVAVLGILKVGCAYLPLDPAYPRERLAFMLRDAGAAALLTRQPLAGRIPEPATAGDPDRRPPVICLDRDGPAIAARPSSPPATRIAAEQLAYAIYTSGSTGRPKGVAMPHGALANLIRWQTSASTPAPGAVTLQFASLSFDVSFQEMFSTWSSGGTLVLVSEETRRDPGALLELVADRRIERLFLPFVALHSLAQAARDHPVPTVLRDLVTAGEQLRMTAALCGWLDRLPPCRLHNQYGPSESHVTTAWTLAGDAAGAPLLPPVGRPIRGHRSGVLDARLRPVAIGGQGELVIGGTGLARGYLGRPGLTAARFVPDPTAAEPGGRLYRTGDLARFLASGELEFLGRIDDQVKVRGYRIELGEIETALGDHPAVGKAAVGVREDSPGNRRLVGYVVPLPGADEAALPSPDALRGYLRQRLPEHMVPAVFMALEVLPLTASGKLDRRSLPAPRGAPDGGRTAPRTPTEELVAGIWRELLELETVGVYANFFDLGGHSLVATQVVSRLRERFGVELPVKAIFDHPTVAELAGRIEEAMGAGGVLAAVEPGPREGALAMSFSQQRLFLLDQLAPGNPFYNLPTALRLTGALSTPALERAFDELVCRHEALRTTFDLAEGRPVQRVGPPVWGMAVVDLRALPPAARPPALARLLLAAARQPFDLRRGPLLRVTLCRLAVEEHVLLVTLHHIAGDGWSLEVLGRELALLYGACRARRSSTLAELLVQYADFAAWQRRHLAGENLAVEVAYWCSQLAGAPMVLELPTDRPRPAEQSFAGGTLHFELDARLTGNLGALSRRAGTTLFMTLMAGWQAVLHRHSGQRDFLVGSPVAGRSHRQLEELIGCFINVVALRADLAGDPTVAELLARVRRAALGAYAHQELPFDRLVEELDPPRDRSRNPLFQVLFQLLKAPAAPRFSGLRSEVLEIDNGTSRFDLELLMTEVGDRLAGVVEYDCRLFDATTVARLLGHYRRLLAAMADDSQGRLSQLPLLSAAERHQLLGEWNDTRRQPPEGGLLHRPFEAQALRTPEAVALVAGERSLSYRELDRRANQLAHHLGSLGVGPEVRVAILLDRSPEMVVAMLAVLKAGGVYVPLDPAYPEERLHFLLQDTAARVVLTCAARRAELPSSRAHPVLLDRDREIFTASSEAPAVAVAPDNLAYVIHTSGSTGRPKGVAIRHKSARVLLEWARETFAREELAVTLAATSICFDLSVYECFVPLGVGGRVVLVENVLELGAVDPGAGITLVNTVPSAMSELLHGDGLPGSVAAVNLAGETLTGDLARRVRAASPDGVRLWNLYGPSEDTTYSTGALVAAGDRCEPTIGRPLAETRCFLLDRGGRPVPAGVLGELCLGGAGLARGYLGRPGLTAEHFVPDPFGEGSGERLYRTGDLARYRSDGEIEFAGRVDHQVKIRGFRVELGEVEAALSRSSEVSECVVGARRDPTGSQRLVAYVVAQREPPPTAGELRGLLRRTLPESMVPSVWVFLAALPRTPNGKVDRRALPEPDLERLAGDSFAAPRTPTEEVLAGIWAEVLDVDRIGYDDNFFELGGHSLMANQVTYRVRRVLGLEVEVGLLFTHPTLDEMARQLERARTELRDTSVPALRREPRGPNTLLPTSFSQRGLWILDRLQGSSEAFNIPLGLRLGGPLELPALAAAINEIVRRHEVMRTSFPEVAGEPVQAVTSSVPRRLPVVDLRALPAARRPAAARRLVRREVSRPFDLAQPCQLRVLLLRLDSAEHVLLLTVHHIVFDGWSVGVLMRELGALYRAFADRQPSPLPEPAVQFGDFAVWQRRLFDTAAVDRLAAYWRQQLGARPAVLELPTDRPRPPVLGHRGDVVRTRLDAPLVERLEALGRARGATLFMTLLSAFGALLGRYCAQRDILIGSPVANRNHAELEDLIGFFVDTLVLHADLAGDPSFTELLERVRQTALSAYAHQELPFEKLVEILKPPRDPSRSPLFQVMLVLNNEAPLELGGLEADWLTPSGGTARFDFTLDLTAGRDGIAAEWEYNLDLFDATTIGRLAAHFHTLLTGLAAAPERRLSELPLLSASERQQLREWNQRWLPFDRGACVHQLFEAQAAAIPEAVAVVCGEQALSYGELAARADQLAHHLRSLGVREESWVGVCLERSLDLVVALLGILKAGGAYVPLDPAYPRQRLRYMAADAGLRVLVTEDALAPLWADSAVPQVRLDGDRRAIARRRRVRLTGDVRPECPVYVIYTSGSTGRPKGVVIPHRAMVNFLQSMARQPGLGRDDTLLALTTLAFDIAGLEIFLPLAFGARLVVAPGAASGDGELLTALLAASRATVVQATPVTWRILLETGWRTDRRRLLCGGEALPRELADRLLAGGAELWNLYGPTETTVWSTTCRVDAGGGPVPLGGPIANTEIHLLDLRLRPVPTGAAGELCLGGAGLARGYLRRPSLTADRFVPHPRSDEPGARLYRTGDLVRQHADGRLEFLGRLDFQVKIRGFRIELQEIEAVLRRGEGVSACVVVAREDVPGEPRLVAYVVAAEQRVVEWRALIEKQLPDYMVPQAFVVLEQLPLTPNGKVDRKALPAPGHERSEMTSSYLAPRDPLEELLTQIWSRVLGVEPIGVRDNFFELGGHSLLAIHVMTHIRSRFGHDLPVMTLLRAPTVERLAALLQGRTPAERYSPLVPLQPAGAKRPFFCVHPAGGQVLRYVPLARLMGNERPFYALQARGLDTEDEPMKSVEEMAECYLEAIRSVEPHGPYLLGGYSLGGLVAYEMACRLEAAGEEVSFVGLIDMTADAAEGMDLWDDIQVLAFWAQLFAIPVSEEFLRGLPPEERLSHALKLAKEMKKLPPEFTETDARRYLRVHQMTLWATRVYEPRAYGRRVHLFRGEDEDDSEQELGWAGLTAGVQVEEIPGEHRTILSMPHIRTLAEKLKACLEEADRG